MSQATTRIGRPSRSSTSPPEVGGHARSAGQTQSRRESVNKLVEEIDDLLEQNAEEFIKQYVQRGGQ